MENNQTFSPDFLHKRQGKGTNIAAFFKAVPYLNPLNCSTLGLLAHRFALCPEMLALLLNIAAKGGGLYDS